MSDYLIPLSKLCMQDIERVGGKNASLGEMLQHLDQAGVKVPGGFATTATLFQEVMESNALLGIYDELDQLDIRNIQALSKLGMSIRERILQVNLPETFVHQLNDCYLSLGHAASSPLSVAVRSSATAEDLPDASFAGQQETYLNVLGIDNIVNAIKKVFASLFTDRAIAYRVHQNFSHRHVSLSVAIQKMVRSDLGCSGVMFTLDTESGFDEVVFITASYGLGELIVQGAVNPDEFYVYKHNVLQNKPAVLRRALGTKRDKMIYAAESSRSSVQIVGVEPELCRQFTLSDDECHRLTEYAIAIEKHYQRPMDIEWAKDGETGELYILQARPETVKSRETDQVIRRFELKKCSRKILAEGRAIGERIGTGTAKVIKNLDEMEAVKPGDVLVTDMTDPDWEPIMKMASAIVTNRGGRTCHAAIIAREMGVPAVVGCNSATRSIRDGEQVTVVCSEGDTGTIYQGQLDYDINEINVTEMPKIACDIMMNVANPERAFEFSRLPNAGVGLARLEFIINSMIGIHPGALLEFDKLPDDLKTSIRERTAAYESPKDFYIERLVEGVATIAASFYPKPIIVRLSDFKSNEYANLLGGAFYEPDEENPMIGFRGAARYIATEFRECFELECIALKKVREAYGFENVQIMVPFVRTVQEADEVIDLMTEFGLVRGVNGLKLIMMCELPANAVLADDFLQRFDGFSIGSNDMTQLTLGLDRDSALIAQYFDERNPAVKELLSMAISSAKKMGKYIGICGQGPSDFPELADWLMAQGVDSMSLNPDTVMQTWLHLAKST